MVNFCGILIKFPSIWYTVGFCMMKIECDIEQSVKKMIRQNEYLSQFPKTKILPRSNVTNSAKNRPTETFHTPNWRKFYEDFNGLFRFEIAKYLQGENTISPRLIFMHIAFYFDKYKKSGLIKTKISPSIRSAILNLGSSAKSPLNFHWTGILQVSVGLKLTEKFQKMSPVHFYFTHPLRMFHLTEICWHLRPDHRSYGRELADNSCWWRSCCG